MVLSLWHVLDLLSHLVPCVSELLGQRSLSGLRLLRHHDIDANQKPKDECQQRNRSDDDNFSDLLGLLDAGLGVNLWNEDIVLVLLLKAEPFLERQHFNVDVLWLLFFLFGFFFRQLDIRCKTFTFVRAEVEVLVVDIGCCLL